MDSTKLKQISLFLVLAVLVSAGSAYATADDTTPHQFCAEGQAGIGLHFYF